ncbi:MAG TPA: hypothetical protein ENH35_03465 [Candidatus Moranbacteria bacterium]|nr:hypothetical protein [Candidatus Moranbacteria bacterium]
MALTFKNRGSSNVGRFSRNSARRTIGEHFHRLSLDSKTKEHFIRELDRGGDITGKEFNDIVNDAHEKGLINSQKAEKIKDIVKLPDNYNKHWK